MCVCVCVSNKLTTKPGGPGSPRHPEGPAPPVGPWLPLSPLKPGPGGPGGPMIPAGPEVTHKIECVCVCVSVHQVVMVAGGGEAEDYGKRSSASLCFSCHLLDVPVTFGSLFTLNSSFSFESQSADTLDS